ncbi:unnamed protein product [Cylindrotheca closterium]|uniref:Calcineurin-like phosphoesterase domain-containing protein n=1 Tax=Cylindrotheca closterium TaxID=2856 RepID=A0AAD2CMK7_9STRA|nr:unnamed protein product [Cylindrotheca closterium]
MSHHADNDVNNSAETSSGNNQQSFWCSHRRKLLSAAGALLFIGLGIAVDLLSGDGAPLYTVMWFVGLPVVFLILRYLWLRLCRDPFLSQSDTLTAVTWESTTTCPPSLQRTVPTILFWTFIVLCFAGAVLGFDVRNENLEPDMFIVVTYSGFGSLLILLSAVWLVDALCLCYLFVIRDKILGHTGVAQDWWYRTNIVWASCQQQEAAAAPQSVATTATGNSETAEAADTVKSRQLDQIRSAAKWRLLLIILLYIWWTVWSYFAAYDPTVLILNVPVPKLPPQCDGYKLAMAADLHVGSMAGLSDAERMVNNLNALNPDAIALVGDIGDQPVTAIIRQKMAPLARLKAPDGVYMSFGNHENIKGVEGYRKLLRDEAPFAETVVLLENQHAILDKASTDGCSVALIGMADWSGQRDGALYEDQIAPDFEKAIRVQAGLNGTSIEKDEPISSDLPMIMLQHQPCGIKQAAKDGVGLQLSGHTHGGQIWPNHITLLSYDGIAGLAEFDVGSEHGPSYLFVSEGVVGWGPRLRFLSRTDIALLTLRTPEAMKAEGLKPDLSVSVATAAMYFATAIIPISLVLWSIPVCCWVRQRRTDRRQQQQVETESKDKDEEEGKTVSNRDC